MDHGRFVRRLTLPDGVTAPAELTHGDVVARAITRADLADDVAGINAMPGPHPPNPGRHLADRSGHRRLQLRRPGVAPGRVPRRRSYTYVLRDTAGGYLGCCYHSALKHWLAGDFPFPKPYSSNRQPPGRPRQPPRPHGGENAVGVGS